MCGPKYYFLLKETKVQIEVADLGLGRKVTG